MTLKVEWRDGGRDPKCAPDPLFPHGMDVDASEGSARACSVELTPYPTPRCGMFIVTCDKCGLRTGLTTAGRPDDPRSVKLACFVQKLHPEGSTLVMLPNSLVRTPRAVSP